MTDFGSPVEILPHLISLTHDRLKPLLRFMVKQLLTMPYVRAIFYSSSRTLTAY